ncbi:MAG: SpoVG family protein [Oscillospiraceae bacterium]|nr:SpoVG family protein [Oscillospiraceae bacterium]
MYVTDFKIRHTFTEGDVLAIVSITLDDSIAVHDIRIINGKERRFIAMPSRKDSNGVFRDVVHPIKYDVRERLEAVILASYDAYIEYKKWEAEQDEH